MSDIPAEKQSFIYYAFDRYWLANMVKEPTRYFSLREAMVHFRTYTKMEQYAIAAQLGVGVNRLNYIELHGGPISQMQFEILIQLAKSYTLIGLVDFFESQKAYASFRVAPKRGRKAKGLSGTGEDPEWMQIMGDGA